MRKMKGKGPPTYRCLLTPIYRGMIASLRYNIRDATWQDNCLHKNPKPRCCLILSASTIISSPTTSLPPEPRYSYDRKKVLVSNRVNSHLFVFFFFFEKTGPPSSTYKNRKIEKNNALIFSLKNLCQSWYDRTM